MKSPCPCCGYLTFDHPANGLYDICPVCFWEDDEIQNENPDYAGGANHLSLNEAKGTFAQIGAIEARLVKFVRPPRPEEIPPMTLTDGAH